MRVAVLCEYSGLVRDAFAARGHEAWSCDILETESPGRHYKGDAFRFLNSRPDWDLIIGHPPCTAMAVCGNRFYSGTEERKQAQLWTRKLWDLCLTRAPKVCFENPVSTLSQIMPVKASYIHPWQFGHPETKKTGLWLWNLAPLEPTDNVFEEMMALPPQQRHRIHRMPPGPDRGKERSRFYSGIANAMAAQWG